jgi:hypothetical protein
LAALLETQRDHAAVVRALDLFEGSEGPMFQRSIGPILTVVGAMILAASLAANVIGQFALARALGIGGDPGFGTEQTAGALLGVVVVLVGIWLWVRPGAAESSTGRYLAVILAVAIVIGGPLYLMLKITDAFLRPLAGVQPCVEVRPVPSSAGSTGHKRLSYGIRLANAGKVAIRVDSMWLRAYRDTTASPLLGDEVVTISNRLWEQIDSMALRASSPGKWGVRAGQNIKRMRSLILPPDAQGSLYRFAGQVFFEHGDPAMPTLALAGPDWVDGFSDECP